MKIAALALAAALLPAPLLAQSGVSRLFDQPAGNTPAAPVSPAGAMLMARDAQGIVAALRDMGYRADLETDSVGDPLIRSSDGGINFSIYFYGCQKADGCDSIQFYAGLDLRQGMTYEQVNDWSMNKRFGRVYLDNEMDPAIEMDVLMPFGITRDTFADHVRLWGVVLGQFKEHVNW